MTASTTAESTPFPYGLGTDLVEIDRIRQACQRHGDRFLQRIFTQEELDYCLAARNPYPHLAARFAAKEAISKCFGTGIGAEFGWQSAAILRDSLGAPRVQLDAPALALLRSIGGAQVKVSLSHTRDLAIAVALIVPD